MLAAHAVENAKLLLASGLGGASGRVGEGLMDHPALYAWGLSPVPVGAFRGPLSTAGIDDLRGGEFRASHAAFRFDIGNDGWRAPTGAPDTSVAAAVNGQRNVRRRAARVTWKRPCRGRSGSPSRSSSCRHRTTRYRSTRGTSTRSATRAR